MKNKIQFESTTNLLATFIKHMKQRNGNSFRAQYEVYWIQANQNNGLDYTVYSILELYNGPK